MEFAMALEMREICEKCRRDLPHESRDAFICSYECTFCRDCADGMERTCPNCGGELRRRPRRQAKSG
jgi:hypothetical protein